MVSGGPHRGLAVHTCIRSPPTLAFHPVCHRTLSYTVLHYTGGPCWLFILNTVVCLPGGSNGKESTCYVGDLGLIPGLGRSPEGDPLEEGMATHSIILAWRIPWTEDPGGQQSMGLQRVGHT